MRIYLLRASILTLMLLFAGQSLHALDCEPLLAQRDEPLEASLAANHYDMFVVLPKHFSGQKIWLELSQAVLQNDLNQVVSAYSQVPDKEKDRALRFLAYAKESGFAIPESIQKLVDGEMAAVKLRRQKTYTFDGLTTFEQRDLTYALILVGIRRSKLQRVWERARALVTLPSRDLVPIVQSHRAENALGDEARALVEEYKVTLDYQKLLTGLFDLYLKRQFQITHDPWFNVQGTDLNLVDFVNTGTYQQPVPNATNTWMHLITLTSNRVQNPQLKGLSRELWWNRSRGINPLGTVRLSRNALTLKDGTEKTMSVEVLRKTEDGYFIPFQFEAGANGRFFEPDGSRAMKKVISCFACHLRLSGIFFGGINMPGYKAVDDWHVNAIDLTRRRYYSKFAAFRSK